MYSFVILPRHCAFEEMRHLFVSFALSVVVFAVTREAYFSYRQRPAPKTVEGRRRWKRWPSSAAVCFYCWSLWMFCCTCSGNFNARWVEIGRCVVFSFAGRASATLQRGALARRRAISSCVVTVRTVRSSTDHRFDSIHSNESFHRLPMAAMIPRDQDDDSILHSIHS